MSTHKPEPYDIDATGDPHVPPGRVEVFAPQGEVDERARSPTMTAIALEPGRRCVGCGYDLSGLLVGGNCPECGAVILSMAPRADFEAYKRMPRWYLRSLGAVLTAMAILPLLGVALIAYGSSAIQSASSQPIRLTIDLYQVFSLAWLAVVVCVCLPPPEREPALGIGRSRSDLALAIAAVVSQLGVIVSAFHVLALSNPNPGWLVWPLVVSFIGLALVGFQLSRIAWRLNDDDRGRRLQSAALSIPVGFGFALLFGLLIRAHIPALRLFGAPFIMLQFLGVVLQAGGCVYLLWSAWSLGREAEWAIRNTEAAEARVERIRLRAQEEFERARRERDAESPFGGPIP